MDTSGLTNAESWLTILNVAKLVAAFLVAIGVAVEFGTDFIARPYENVVKEAKEVQLKSLEIEASLAKVELAEAQTKIAQANLKASEAIQKAEAERKERLKLEGQIASRYLNANQQRDLTAALMQFRGMDVSVSSYALDADAAIFGDQLLEIIKNAGLTPVDRRMSEGALGSIALGVHVAGTNPALVRVLIDCLNSFGIQTLSGEPPPSSGMSLGGQGASYSSKIFVGVKPLPK